MSQAPPSHPGQPVSLRRALRTLADELQAQTPPPLRPRAAPATVCAPAPPAAAALVRRGWFHVFLGGTRALPAVWAGAAACVLVLIGSAWLMSAPSVRGGGERAEVARASGFLPLAPIERWAAEDGGADAAWLVNTEMPNERLAALGLPFDPARAGETVRAQLLMRPSGEVLAVRFVR